MISDLLEEINDGFLKFSMCSEENFKNYSGSK